MSGFFERFRRRLRGDGEAMHAETRELLDLHHDRASVSGDGQLVVSPTKVFSNIELAMERVEVDIDTSVAIEDFISEEEALVMAGRLSMGAAMIAHVLNTGDADHAQPIPA